MPGSASITDTQCLRRPGVILPVLIASSTDASMRCLAAATPCAARRSVSAECLGGVRVEDLHAVPRCGRSDVRWFGVRGWRQHRVRVASCTVSITNWTSVVSSGRPRARAAPQPMCRRVPKPLCPFPSGLADAEEFLDGVRAVAGKCRHREGLNDP